MSLPLEANCRIMLNCGSKTFLYNFNVLPTSLRSMIDIIPGHTWNYALDSL